MAPKHVILIQNGSIRTSESGEAPIPYANDIALAEAASKLIDAGYTFVDEPSGWSPAAILRNLQQQHLLTREFIAITWTGPGQYRTYNVAE